MPSPTKLTLETRGQLHPGLEQEWLLTNGLGTFASSTAVGCNTRRYHGLLCAALLPPVGRFMLLNRVGELLILDGQREHPHEFSINQFRQNMHPRGDRYLQHFELTDIVRFEYLIEGVRIIKEVQLLWEQNAVGLRYQVHCDRPRQVELQLLPFVSLRDFHALRSSSNARLQSAASSRQVSVRDGERGIHIQADNGSFVERGDWWYGHVYPIETQRGQDDTEDLFTPGTFIVPMQLDEAKMGAVTLWAGDQPTGLPNWESARKQHPNPPLIIPDSASQRVKDSVQTLSVLARAAADFIVRRKQPDGSAGTTVLAGYPWFADWGRDTMIALPGLFLATGRFEEAAQVLGLFAQYVSDGMIPNRFDDYTNEPHYNTVDASLWFIHAAHEFARLSGDQQMFDTRLRPACEAILSGYQNGTRFNIRMDPDDFLISAGDANTQLTWMDAKQGDIAFTPRHGKAIEINALWYSALKQMAYHDLATHVAENFVKRFYINDFRGLNDVIGTTNGNVVPDGSLRPNQIFAVSLPHSPLSHDQQHAVVEVVRRELLTPFGLRTLARSDAKYRGRYEGDVFQRDGAYHNGTVWPWLIGPFLDAYLRVEGETQASLNQARQWLLPLQQQFKTRGCIGQICEIFDGDEPHRPAGCFAQAWSVAEVLRLAIRIGA